MAKRQVPTKPTARPVGRDKDTAYLEGSISATREAALCHNHASDSNYDEQGHWLNPGLVWKAAVAMELFCVMLLTVWLEATGASNVSLANIEGGTENANAELWMRTHLPKAQVKALGLKEKAGFANVYAVVSGCVPSAGATSVSLFIVLSCFGCRVAALICALAWSLVLMDMGLVMTTGAHMTLSLLQFCASQAWVSRETFAMNINIALGMLLGGNIVNAAISLAKVSGTHLVIMICMRRAYRTVRSSRTAKRFIATILAAVVVVEFGVIAVTSLAIVETHDFRKATTAPLFGVNRKCKPSNALLSIGAEAWAAAFSSSTDSLWTETSQFGEVFLPRPHRSVAGSKGAPRVVHQQDNKPFDDGGPVGVVLLLLESTRASSFSGLHEDVAADYTRDPRDASLAPPRPSFISKLAHFPGSRAARFAFPTMPNTNKVLWEGLTGLTPLLETSWDEFNTNGPYWSSLKKECLPRRLSEDLNWDTLFANPVMSTSGSVQQLLGFEKVAFRDTLFKECRADLISREPSCERIVFQLDDDCLNFMVKACRKKKCLKASIGDSLRSVFLKHAAAAAQAGSKSLQTQTSNESINDNNCGGWFGDPLTISQVNTCFDSPCLFGVHLRGELSSRLRPDRLMFSDYLLAIPALNFAKNSIRNNRNFFITLLTTAAHHPYAHQGLKTPLIQSINESHDERLQYASAVDQGDILASTIFNGLKEAGIGNRTLFIVAGDHGEAFGEGGHRQHGSCLQADCIRVPFVVHDPVAGSARHKEFRQLSATETAHHLTPSRRRLAAGVTPDKLNGSINWMHGLTSSVRGCVWIDRCDASVFIKHRSIYNLPPLPAPCAGRYCAHSARVGGP